jgi:hypothetical protein
MFELKIGDTVSAANAEVESKVLNESAARMPALWVLLRMLLFIISVSWLCVLV